MPATNPGTTGLVSWWSLNETSGNRLDSHGANHLTPGGALSYAAGKVGNAADFESGASDTLKITDAAQSGLNPSGAFTVAGWVKFETLFAASNPVITKWQTPTDLEYWLAWWSSNSRITLFVRNSANTVSTSIAATTFGALSTGTWYFVAGWYDGANIGVSVNGTANTTAYSSGVYNGASAFSIGSFSTTYGDSLIDECLMYSRALSMDELDWLYNAGAGRAYSALTATKGLPVLSHWHDTMFLR